jgi:hypothetical protein
MNLLIWAIELHDTLAIAVTKDQSMPVLLLLLPLLQFAPDPSNIDGSGATCNPQLQVSSDCPLPSLQTSPAGWTNGAAHLVGGR